MAPVKAMVCGKTDVARSVRGSLFAHLTLLSGIAALTSTILLAGLLANPSPAYAAEAPVALGAAATYSVLGGTGVTNTGSTVLSEDLGVSPGNSIAGFPPGVVGGTIHPGDVQAAQAQSDMLAAYNDAASRTPISNFAGDQNGQTFTGGVYHTAAAFALTGTLTLDGQNDPNAVFIFQVDAALNTAAASQISLINGAQASHVFWQVLGAVGTGANSSFTGTIMAAGAATVGASAVVMGRVLSRGLVTLANNTVTTTSPVAINGGSTAYTNDTTPTIAGTAEVPAGTLVTVNVAGTPLTTTVQGDGTWSVTQTTALAEGTYPVLASVTDTAGNTSTATQSLTVDTTAPVVAIAGGAAAFTSTATPSITGTTDAAFGTTVTVTIAPQTLTTAVQSGGNWSVTAATLTNGSHSVVATVRDPAGNTGTASQSLTVDTSITPVALRTTGTYSVLGVTGVTNTGPTTISGDLGVSPSGTVVGFGPGAGTVGGTTHVNDAEAAQAQADLVAAYSDAAGRTPTGNFAGDQIGQTFTAGVFHTAAAFALTGTLILDGQNDPNAVFIFQVDAALNTAAASHVNLINGAQASHVFWQVAGAAGTGANSSFAGTIMAAGAITVGNLAVVEGRALSRGLVTLAANTINTPAPIGGALTISVPANAGNLGTLANTLGGGTISGPLGVVQVNDARSAAAGSGWVASVTTTAFTAPSGATIAASAVGYTCGTITRVGTATYTANNPGSLTAVAPAVTATGITGDNSATWNPTINVAIPGSTSAGVYSATITHSVL